MSALYVASYVLLWILVAVLALLVLLLYRQYGRSVMAPLERINNSGLSVGEKLAPLSAHTEDGQLSSINWNDAAEGTAVLFAAPGCALCDHILGEKLLDALAAKWKAVRFIWIDGDAQAHEQARILARWQFTYSPGNAAHRLAAVPVTPFFYTFDNQGRVLSKGLVNQADDLSHVLEQAFPERLAAHADQEQVGLPAKQ
jgi:thiol-disulfide isomerase/thioredoxin